VLSNRYGDCKDKAVLLKALLKARGIDSSLVLTSLGGQFGLPELPTLDVFNHAVLYLPEWQLYLDPTGGFLPFGVLSLANNDKPALHIDDGQGLQRIASTTPAGNQYQSRTELTVNDDGRVEGRTQVTVKGAVSAVFRLGSASMGDSEKAQHVRDLLVTAGQSGHGEWKNDDVWPLGRDEFSVYADYTLDQHLEKGSLWELPCIGVGQPLFQGLTQAIGIPAQAFKRICHSMALDEELIVHFPATWTVARLPGDRTEQNGPLLLTSGFRFDADKHQLQANWQGRFEHAGDSCDGAELLPLAPQMRSMMRKNVVEIL